MRIAAKGSFVFDTTLEINNHNIHITPDGELPNSLYSGQQYFTKITCAADVPAIKVIGTNFSIRGVAFNDVYQAIQFYPGALQVIWPITIEKCFFTNLRNSGLLFDHTTGSYMGVFIRENWFDTSVAATSYIDFTTAAGHGAFDIHIDKNVLQSTPASKIKLSAVDNTVEIHSCDGNYIEGVGGKALDLTTNNGTIRFNGGLTRNKIYNGIGGYTIYASNYANGTGKYSYIDLGGISHCRFDGGTLSLTSHMTAGSTAHRISGFSFDHCWMPGTIAVDCEHVVGGGVAGVSAIRVSKCFIPDNASYSVSNCKVADIIDNSHYNWTLLFANVPTLMIERNFPISGIASLAITPGTNTFRSIRGNALYKTENSGSSTGTGSEQSIAHGLVAIPTGCKAWIKYPISATRFMEKEIDFDATNIYPCVNTGIVYEWRIE
jgi:hypothetical protein